MFPAQPVGVIRGSRSVAANRWAATWPDPVDRQRYKVIGAVTGAVLGMLVALPADRKTAANGGMIPLWPVAAALGGVGGWWLGGVVYDHRGH